MIVFLIDFDNTLADNELIKTKISSKVEKLYSKSEVTKFWDTYSQEMLTKGSLDFLSFVNEYTKDKEKTNQILTDEVIKPTLYPKVIPTLKKLKNVGQIYIYTEGGLDYQKRKISLSGILPYVKDVFYFNSKMKYLQSTLQTFDTKKLIYVEDKPNYLLTAKNLFPEITTVLIKQGKYASQLTSTEEKLIDYTLNNFYELTDLTFD